MAKRKMSIAGKVRKNSEERSRGGASYGYLNLPQGVNVFKVEPGGRIAIDIIPYIVTDKTHPDNSQSVEINAGDLWYKRPFKLHRGIGVDKESIICPTSFGKRCPICNYRAERMKSGAPKEETGPLRPSERNLYVVKPIGMKGFEEKFHIWDISSFCFQNMLSEEIEESEENAAFANLEDGLTLKVRFSEESIGGGGGGKATAFAKVSRIDFVDRNEAYDESILEDVPDLDKVLACPEYKALERKFLELDEEDEEEPKSKPAPDEEEEKPEPKRRKKPEPEPDEEEDEPEPPKRKRKKAEPEPEADEEEEAPTPPKKKAKAEKESSGKCPHGHKFGKDCDGFEECDECDMWDDCIEEKEK